MSAAAHHASPDHIPHVTPLPIYMKTFGTLMVLTVITVGASYVNLGTTVNLIIAVIIATIKASVVGAFFMHLATDSRFNLVVFASSVVFLGIFVGFTMLDTSARGMHEPKRRERVPVVTAADGKTKSFDPWHQATPVTSVTAAPAAGAPAPATK